MAMVTVFVAVVTVLPEASSIVTVTAGVMEAPAATFDGGTLKTNFEAVPAVTLNGVLAAVSSPVALAVNV